ncbi:hypothetical protein LCGC14_0874100 [marine sediment metagenome]|uniref:Uncharacterized protein n=1 Tax=marine sediment metagenome TaxID=412755 RepID=A0A0F9P8S1_9ZZZZ
MKRKSLFNHLNAIYTDQSADYYDELSVEDRKTYSIYMINRLVSMNIDFVEIVNAFQKYWEIVKNRESYLFYSQCLPLGKQWNKYIKPKVEPKHEEWVVRLIAFHFEVSQLEATDYIDLFMATPEGKARLKEILEMYGTEPRKIKKVVR